ncbi:DUF4392 domain-containing protein [Sulfurospirillum sp. 1307]|jgi:hypothetical protein
MLVDEVVLKYSDRGMDVLQKLHPKEHIKEAADAFLNLEKGTVFLYTGFWVAGFAETDGPVGTYFLAKALNALGYKSVIITDEYCKDFFKEIETIYLPIKEEINYKEILETYKPIAHISIERCGKNINGKYENARSQDISSYTARVDELFEEGRKSAPTFSIGDGGNEVGMGNYKEDIQEHLTLVPCKVECDYLMLASVSNWGAYGFIACLDKNLIPTFEEVDEYLGYIVSLGSVDGIKKECVKSVDGKDWELEKEILEDLKRAKV